MSTEHHPAARGFGRRDPRPIAMPAGPAGAGARLRAERNETPAAGGLDRFRPALLILFIPPTLLCLEGMLSGTSLLTPIDPLFANIMWWFGFILGIPLAALSVLNPHKPIGPVKSLLVLFGLPFLTAFATEGAAWRIADWVEFTGSSARFEPASYPIKFASHGHKGRRDSFEIDPFDLKSPTYIAVPSAQFDATWLDYSDYCVTVMQRRSASGAVEILNDGIFTLNEPAPAVLSRCSGARGSR